MPHEEKPSEPAAWTDADLRPGAEPPAAAVRAFGDGETYAQHFYLRRVAPSIKSILSNTGGPFASIFEQFQGFKRPTEGGGR